MSLNLHNIIDILIYESNWIDMKHHQELKSFN